jgi:hypothetical protein
MISFCVNFFSLRKVMRSQVQQWPVIHLKLLVVDSRQVSSLTVPAVGVEVFAASETTVEARIHLDIF